METYKKELAGVAVGFGVGLAVGYFLCSRSEGSSRVNANNIHPESKKIVDTCAVGDIEDGGKKVYCRCFRSAKFPYCDGAHNKHNEDTGDNVGPLIVKKE
mmetsp:Transcript_36010/g.101385  ORF Transcript_36010/g.101385 Transcript_36010/m.101385 type:complete len:100 (+) Transcript_36010:51-350(+)